MIFLEPLPFSTPLVLSEDLTSRVCVFVCVCLCEQAVAVRCADAAVSVRGRRPGVVVGRVHPMLRQVCE